MTAPPPRQLTLEDVPGDEPSSRPTKRTGRPDHGADANRPHGTISPARRAPVSTPQTAPRRGDDASSTGRTNSRPRKPADVGGAAPKRSLLTADEVAAKLGMDKEWIWEQSRRGRIPTIRLGRFYRYREDAIDAWLVSIERGSVRSSAQQ